MGYNVLAEKSVGEGGSLWICPVGAQSSIVLSARGGRLADGVVHRRRI
jgi:hypothetical protein